MKIYRSIFTILIVTFSANRGTSVDYSNLNLSDPKVQQEVLTEIRAITDADERLAVFTDFNLAVSETLGNLDDTLEYLAINDKYGPFFKSLTFTSAGNDLDSIIDLRGWSIAYSSSTKSDKFQLSIEIDDNRYSTIDLSATELKLISTSALGPNSLTDIALGLLDTEIDIPLKYTLNEQRVIMLEPIKIAIPKRIQFKIVAHLKIDSRLHVITIIDIM